MTATPTGATRLAAVIGSPIRHSLSPVILNAAFAAAALDWVFVALEVAPGSGRQAVESMRTLGLGGLSVTMPHKDDAAATVDRLTPAAAALSAVNCVYWDDGQLVGDSTDGAGLLDSLRLDHRVDPSGAHCVVLGAGGAARAVVAALAAAGASRVTVANRTATRAETAAALAGPAGAVADLGDLDTIRSADLVINATSVGMGQPASAGQSPVPGDVFRPGQVALDLVYLPTETAFLAAATAAGATACNGTGMLVHQAAHAFSRWTGVAAPVDAMLAAVQSELAARNSSTTDS